MSRSRFPQLDRLEQDYQRERHEWTPYRSVKWNTRRRLPERERGVDEILSGEDTEEDAE